MVSHFISIHGDLPQLHRQSGRSNIGQGQKRRGKRWCLILCHVAQIVVNELIFKLLCSYRRENQAWEKEKEEEEEISQWGLISPSCLIHANKGKHPKQAISENYTNDQRSTAAPWHTIISAWIFIYTRIWGCQMLFKFAKCIIWIFCGSCCSLGRSNLLVVCPDEDRMNIRPI